MQVMDRIIKLIYVATDVIIHDEFHNLHVRK